jgi:hypothetical protein
MTILRFLRYTDGTIDIAISSVDETGGLGYWGFASGARYRDSVIVPVSDATSCTMGSIPKTSAFPRAKYVLNSFKMILLS